MDCRDAHSTACKLAFASQIVTSWQRDKKLTLQDNSAMSLNTLRGSTDSPSPSLPPSLSPLSLPLSPSLPSFLLEKMVLMKEGSSVLDYILAQALCLTKDGRFG